MNNEVVDPHLTATIVGSYVRHHTVEAGLVSELITSVHGALAQLGRPNQPQEAPTPAVSVRQSVHHDYVVCLDCGYKAKMLQRHISTQHGLSRDEYLLRWGLRSDHSLTAPAYSEQRSTLAKKLGLGHRVKAKAKKAGHATAPMAPVSKDADPKFAAKPGRRGSGGSTSKSDFIKEAAGENIPASPRQSRSRNNPAAHRRVSRSSSPRRRRTQ